MKKLLLLFVLLFLFIPSVEAQKKVNVYFFYGDGCPHCASQKPYLEKWAKDYSDVEIHYFEVYNNKSNAKLFEEVANAYNILPQGVPATFIGEKSWLGFSEAMSVEMEDKIEECQRGFCNDKAYSVVSGTEVEEPDVNDEKVLDDSVIKIFGKEFNVSGMPLVLSTVLIAFVDGFNPCSLWVLMFLLGVVVLTGDRKKILLVGLTYLTVAGAVYGFFILGMINIFTYVSYLLWIRIIVATIAIVFALINIKDFFWYKKGISLTISDSYKPKIFAKVRNLMRPENNVKTLILGSATLALGITLVELPCTAGFPLIWSNMIATHQIEKSFFIFLFVLYLLVYIIDELIIFFIVVYTLKVSKFEEKHGRLLKLIGGMIMLSMAGVLLYDPNLLNDIGGTIVVFGGAIVISLIIAKFYKVK